MLLTFTSLITGERVVFANPQKQTAAIKFALINDVNVMTFDSILEADKIADAAREILVEGRKVEVIARLLVPDEGSKVPLGEVRPSEGWSEATAEHYTAVLHN